MSNTTNQPPAPTGMARAEEVLADFFDDSYGTRESFLTYANAALNALDEAGYVVVPVHTCPHCAARWTTTVLVDAAMRCPQCAQPDERWSVTLVPLDDARESDHD